MEANLTSAAENVVGCEDGCAFSRFCDYVSAHSIIVVVAHA